MNAPLWDKAKDLLQVLILPTLAWSLWVSRGVEIQRIQLEQSAAEVAELKAKVASSRSAQAPPRSGSPRSRRSSRECKHSLSV